MYVVDMDWVMLEKGLEMARQRDRDTWARINRVVAWFISNSMPYTAHHCPDLSRFQINYRYLVQS